MLHHFVALRLQGLYHVGENMMAIRRQVFPETTPSYSAHVLLGRFVDVSK